jgi:hypothetical protein
MLRIKASQTLALGTFSFGLKAFFSAYKNRKIVLNSLTNTGTIISQTEKNQNKELKKL